MYTLDQIKNVVFTRSNKGYSTSEVDDYIEEVVATVESLQKEKESLMQKLGVLADKIEEYRAQENSIHSTLLTAQRMADQITKEAEEKAAQCTAEAEATVARLEAEARDKARKLNMEAEDDYQRKLADTKLQATRVVTEAKDRAGRMLFEALEKTRAERAALEEMQNRTRTFRDQILAMYRDQVAIIDRLATQERVIPTPPPAHPEEEAPAKPAIEEIPAAEPAGEEAPAVEEIPAAEPAGEEAPAVEEIPVTETAAHEAPAGETPDEEDVLAEEIPAADPAASLADLFREPETDTKLSDFLRVDQPVDDQVPGEAPARFRIEEEPVEKESSGGRFANLKFGEDYDIASDEDYEEDDSSSRGGFFRKKRR